jgi:hypothetical protein
MMPPAEQTQQQLNHDYHNHDYQQHRHKQQQHMNLG